MDDLSRRRLKVAEFGDLNDPFELLSIELADRAARRRFAVWRANAMVEYGVLCFSRTWRYPVLWSHYGDKHRGLCLGFDVPNALLRQVTYLKRRRALDPLLLENEGLGQPGPLFDTKFEHWRYEDEIRRVVRLEEALRQDGWHFWPFGPDLQLKEVVVGARSQVTKPQLQDSLGNRGRGVTLTKARLAFKSFEVVTQRRGFRNSRSPKNGLEPRGVAARSAERSRTEGTRCIRDSLVIPTTL